MAYTDTTRKAANNGSGGSLTVTLNSTVVGSLVVVGASIWNNGSDAMTGSTVTDGANTYANAFRALASVSNERQGTQLFHSVLGTGGNRSIVVDPGAGSYDMSAFAHEFAGPHATPASGTPVTATGTSETTADTGSFTPADADALYVAVDGNSQSGTITQNVSPGNTDWTLSNEHESGVSAEPGSMVFFIRSGSAVARRAAWTIPSGTFWAAGLAGFKPAATGGQTIAVGQVVETDLAQAIAWAPKRRLVGQVLETDVAQALTRLKRRAVGQVTETDLAQGLTEVKRRTLGQVIENDLAQALTRRKVQALAQVLETDSAQTIAWAPKRRLVGQVLETDLAQAITTQGNKIIAVGQVVEADTAQGLARIKVKAIGQVHETDVARPIAWAPKHRLIGQVLELDLAQSVGVAGGFIVTFITLTRLVGRVADVAGLEGRVADFAGATGAVADLTELAGAA